MLECAELAQKPRQRAVTFCLKEEGRTLNSVESCNDVKSTAGDQISLIYKNPLSTLTWNTEAMGAKITTLQI